MKRLTLLLIAATALVLVACGGKTLDTAKVETDLEGIVSTATGGVEATAECPDEVSDAEDGKTYECTLTYAGQEDDPQTVEMVIEGDDGESNFADEDAATAEIAAHARAASEQP